MRKPDDIKDMAELLSRAQVDPSQIVTSDVSDAGIDVAAAESENAPISDGSQPLVDSRLELFVSDMVDGVKPGIAYQNRISPRISGKSAGQQASRVKGRAEIRARLTWLLREKARAQRLMDERAGIEAGKEDFKPGRPGQDGLTKADKIRICIEIANDVGASPIDRLRAMERHGELTGGDRNGRRIEDLDPVDLAEYFRAAEEQGMDVIEIARKRGEESDETLSADDPASLGNGDSKDRGIQPVVDLEEQEHEPKTK